LTEPALIDPVLIDYFTAERLDFRNINLVVTDILEVVSQLIMQQTSITTSPPTQINRHDLALPTILKRTSRGCVGSAFRCWHY
jgi:hypothetical protein